MVRMDVNGVSMCVSFYHVLPQGPALPSPWRPIHDQFQWKDPLQNHSTILHGFALGCPGSGMLFAVTSSARGGAGAELHQELWVK